VRLLENTLWTSNRLARLLCCCVFGMAIAPLAKAAAQSDECNAVLAAVSYSYVHDDSRLKTLLYSLVTRENYDETKKTFGADVPEEFSGKYDDYEKAVTKDKSEHRETLDYSHAREEVRLNTPDSVVTAWLNCKKKSTGLSAFIEHVDKDGVGVIIRWDIPRTGGDLQKVRLVNIPLALLDAAAKTEYSGNSNLIAGDHPIRISFPKTGGPVNGSVAGIEPAAAGGRPVSTSAEIYVPASEAIRVAPQKSLIETLASGGSFCEVYFSRSSGSCDYGSLGPNLPYIFTWDRTRKIYTLYGRACLQPGVYPNNEAGVDAGNGVLQLWAHYFKVVDAGRGVAKLTEIDNVSGKVLNNAWNGVARCFVP
jgi:hypothetical protein